MNRIVLKIGIKDLYMFDHLCDYTYINNILYIVCKKGDGKDNKSYNKIQIYVIKDFILIHKYIHSGVRALINSGILYIFDIDKTLYKYSVEDFKCIEILKINEINNFNINVDNLGGIENLKNNLNNYAVKSKLVYCDKPYIIIYQINNNICRIFDFYNNINYYISTNKNGDIFKISYDNNYIYILDSNNIMSFNVKTKKIKNETINYTFSVSKCKIYYEMYKLHNTKYVIYNIDDIDKCIRTYNVETKEISEYLDYEYMYMGNYNIKDNIYIRREYVCILTKPTISIFSENNNDKMVKLGESFIPLNILIKRSRLVKSMSLDLKDNFELNEIKNDLFEHIDCYIDYIKTNDIKNEFYLFKILNYLEDIDVEHIASYISTKSYGLINSNNIIIYDVLELLYTSPFTPQFIYLLNEILYRKNYNDIINNLKDKSCYNYILKYNLIIHNTNYIRIK